MNGCESAEEGEDADAAEGEAGCVGEYRSDVSCRERQMMNDNLTMCLMEWLIGYTAIIRLRDISQWTQEDARHSSGCQSTHFCHPYTPDQYININIRLLTLPLIASEHISHPNRTVTKSRIVASLYLSPHQRLAKTAIRPLHPRQPIQTLPPPDAPKVIAEYKQQTQREIRRRQIRRIPARVLLRRMLAQIRAGKRAKPAARVLVAVDPVDVILSFLRRGVGRQLVEEVEGGDDEEGQAHAVAVVGGVGVRQVGFETAEEVLRLSLLV